MSDDVDSGFRWSDLPKELLEMIGNCLDSPVDVLRYRSVCTSWRSSVPLPSFSDETPSLRLKLPFPTPVDAVLVKSTVCRLEFLRPDSNSASEGWLTKVSESRNGRLKLLQPLSNYQIRYSPIRLNLLECRFVPLSNAFHVRQGPRRSVFGVNKLVSFPVSAISSKNNNPSILAICQEGKLVHWKHGDENWTILDEQNFQYDDIIEHKGQFYVVDRWGTVSWIDSSLKVIQYSPPLFGCGGQKNLVESCGDLYVVDRYLDGERPTWNEDQTIVDLPFIRRRRLPRKCTPKTLDVRVFKLDEEWGKWVDVQSLDDRAFFLGIDCSFSVSAGDFFGGKGNCIYFTDDDDLGTGLGLDCIRVFRLEDRSIENLGSFPQYSDVFWPPNFYINSNFPGSSNVSV